MVVHQLRQRPDLRPGHRLLFAPGRPRRLGIGCTDTYGSGLNGEQPLGPRSEVNATISVFSFRTPTSRPSAIYQPRLQVSDSDVDPVLNAGASIGSRASTSPPTIPPPATGSTTPPIARPPCRSVTFALIMEPDAPPGYYAPRASTGDPAWPTLDPDGRARLRRTCPARSVERFEAARKVTASSTSTPGTTSTPSAT